MQTYKSIAANASSQKLKPQNVLILQKNCGRGGGFDDCSDVIM